ncbi:MAG: hypothetical protein HQ521_20240 [Bacteroidetes bacterium]|nr:hypothetical protein [Bacteroidota bacterium]
MKQLLNSILTTVVILIISVCCSNNVHGQSNSDSTTILKHSPKKATLLALIPGAGQIYNKKYWKLPIVYAGFGATGYFAFYARGQYLKYNEAYICKVNSLDNLLVVEYNAEQNSYMSNVNETVCKNELATKYSEEELKYYRDSFRRDMEFSFILMAAWYVLQLLDATVDAHLYYWNVDDNISMKIEPVIMQPNISMPSVIPGSAINHNGLKISVNF